MLYIPLISHIVEYSGHIYDGELWWLLTAGDQAEVIIDAPFSETAYLIHDKLPYILATGSKGSSQGY